MTFYNMKKIGGVLLVDIFSDIRPSAFVEDFNAFGNVSEIVFYFRPDRGLQLLKEMGTVETFEAGTGDTPDDYYVLYIHPEVHRLHACEYIVTYQSILPPGTAATAPHLLIYDKWTTIDGLTVPARFTIYEGDKVYASCALENWSFQKPFDTTRMQMPKSATLDTSQP